MRIARARITGADAAHARITRARITRADAAHARITRARITGADITEVRIARARAAGAEVMRAGLRVRGLVWPAQAPGMTPHQAPRAVPRMLAPELFSGRRIIATQRPVPHILREEQCELRHFPIVSGAPHDPQI
ncbi:pentapeptide repeat-containing protein [Actinoplanes sp. NPDC049548]|uniref:pentapeptide repeat-containing protein n=1 Tax=Actinoplanes sp. NPDC049548 TaxID=3155152 RepID=UPI00343F2C44